jgi:hypothetical protein
MSPLLQPPVAAGLDVIIWMVVLVFWAIAQASQQKKRQQRRQQGLPPEEPRPAPDSTEPVGSPLDDPFRELMETLRRSQEEKTEPPPAPVAPARPMPRPLPPRAPTPPHRPVVRPQFETSRRPDPLVRRRATAPAATPAPAMARHFEAAPPPLPEPEYDYTIPEARLAPLEGDFRKQVFSLADKSAGMGMATVPLPSMSVPTVRMSYRPTAAGPAYAGAAFHGLRSRDALRRAMLHRIILGPPLGS